jgi:hypothetical protein
MRNLEPSGRVFEDGLAAQKPVKPASRGAARGARRRVSEI